MARPSSYTPEFREEAVQLALKSAPRPIAQTARELDVHPETLRNWVRGYKREHESTDEASSVDERARLKELEHRVREPEMENSFLKKAGVPRTREVV